jgi:S-formylglutathione hydrolase FrmB
MSHRRYPGLEGWFAAGTSDRGHHLLEPRLARDAARAGIDAHLYLAPGDHSWIFARSTFERLFPILMRSLTARAT